MDLAENRVLMEGSPFTVRCEDPLQSVEIVTQVPPFPMPHEGVFAFELHSRGQLLGSLRVMVSKMPAAPAGQAGPAGPQARG